MTDEQREWHFDSLNHRAVQLSADGNVVRAMGLKNTIAALNALEQELREKATLQARLQTMEQALQDLITKIEPIDSFYAACLYCEAPIRVMGQKHRDDCVWLKAAAITTNQEGES